MATVTQVSNLRLAFDSVDSALHRDVRRLLPSARTLSPADIRDMFLEVGPQLTDRYGQIAGPIAAEFFESTTGMPARLAPLTDHDAVQGSVRALAGDFWTPGREQAFQRIAASLVRHSLQAGRSTVADSASRHRITYARAPEPGACEWCVKLSSRGAVYGSARSAGEGNQWHDNCRCVVEPVGPHDEVSYDVESMYEQYLKNKRNS